MKRLLILIGVILLSSPCGVVFWYLARPPLAQVLLPGARDVKVVRAGLGEWQLTYTAPNAPFDWYWELARRLEAQQWILQNRWNPNDSPTYDPLQPLRFDRRHGGFLWDVIVLEPDQREPNRARIQIRRRIGFPFALAYP